MMEILFHNLTESIQSTYDEYCMTSISEGFGVHGQRWTLFHNRLVGLCFSDTLFSEWWRFYHFTTAQIEQAQGCNDQRPIIGRLLYSWSSSRDKEYYNILSTWIDDLLLPQQ